MLRLFHVSEEPNISVFEPCVPSREDLDKAKKYVWAITEKCLPNFLTPRDCPRIAYHIGEKTTKEDVENFLSPGLNHCLIVESAWFHQILNTTLYIYEFDTTNFYLQDEIAGYYVSEQTEKPINITRIDDIFYELFKRNIEVRILPNLWSMADQVVPSSLNFSLCRMRNAIQRINDYEEEYVSEEELKQIEKLKSQGEFISQKELLEELGIDINEI